MTLPTGGYALSADEGEAVWFLGTRLTVKAGGEVSGGAFTLIEQLCPGDFGTPAHVHELDDEAFYVLDGTLRVTSGDDDWDVGTGGFVFLPKGVPHRFEVVGGRSARLLQVTAPAQFERFAADAGEPATAAGLPAPGPVDVDRLAAAAERHRYRMLFPTDA